MATKWMKVHSGDHQLPCQVSQRAVGVVGCQEKRLEVGNSTSKIGQLKEKVIFEDKVGQEWPQHG